MKAAYFIVIFAGLMIAGCQKKTTPEVAGTASCVCPKENIGAAPGNRVPCNGFVTLTNYTSATAGELSSRVDAYVFFNDQPDTQPNGNFVTVDSVLLDGEQLVLVNDANNAPMYYFMSPAETEHQEWRVYGANGIPSFSISAGLKDPVADFSAVPEKIRKSGQAAFKLSGVTNITGATAMILDRSGKTSWNISVILKEGTNIVCFPPDQLRLLGPGKAVLLILLENTMVRTFNSRNIAFSKKLQYEKEITLEP